MPGRKSPLGGSSLTYEYTVRLLSIGETLFLLRKTPGFSEQCRRWRGRDFRATFFELFAARLFLAGGFQIHAKPEIMVRGEDYDFTAINGDASINVEVTALTVVKYTERTIWNALNDKRDQVPVDAPAVLICIIPETWLDEAGCDKKLENITSDFFRRQTRRINAVVYVSEKHIDKDGDGSYGMLIFRTLVYFHPNPRIPCPELAFLSDGSLNRTGEALRASSDPFVDGVTLLRATSEFYQWVDQTCRLG